MTLAMDLDREFAVGLRASLFDAQVTGNGRAGALPRSMSVRQVHNVLATLRGMLAWALRPDVRTLPAEFVNPLGPDVVGRKPAKDPLRAVKLPQELRIRRVEAMDAWQLCHLAPSLVLPMRPDEATGLLIADVDFERRRLRFGTRLGGRDFNKGRQSFEVPFPAELEPVLRACVAGRGAGPLHRGRGVFEGLASPGPNVLEDGEIETTYKATLAAAGRGTVLTEQDAKAAFRRLLRTMGGASCDRLSREFGGLLRGLGIVRGVRFYDARAAVTTEMNRSGVPGLELRNLTGHAPGDVLNAYVTLDPDGAMAAYFRAIGPLLSAIDSRGRLLLGPRDAAP
ncbi:tyrosine-type recombinase/integrase [Paludisphaera mucosa]|uniref:Tyrosine-type recombinase/integrase n=1 Tax=Paludisphaera mucosa TaxID=3030827 RepID=A0ABT6FE59_9BACT|nr:tyrosine-type recombinase/integrase [Paludisphaera mucosa]MDG3005866.1 tyrosine-type recombinase/integrase [Paludisphaera mucosa]